MSKRKWKDSEIRTFETVKRVLPIFTDLERQKENERSVYDCFSPTVLVELKYRSEQHNHYDEVLVEAKKLKNMSQLRGPQARGMYYISHLDDGIFVWDVIRLKQEGYNFHWEDRMCNATTHFSNRSKILKRVGYLHRKDADYVILNDTNDVMSGDTYYEQRKLQTLDFSML